MVLEGESIIEGGDGCSRQLEQEVERSHFHPQPEIREPPGSGMGCKISKPTLSGLFLPASLRLLEVP